MAEDPFVHVLKRELEVAQSNASICEVGSYGWISENDPDLEFIGHAMWQIDQPPIDQAYSSERDLLDGAPKISKRRCDNDSRSD